MATGNPRNKVALKPGFSLVGWIRLTNSGEDLTGGRKGAVSSDELKKHNTQNDCWTAIRGKVYNITKYMDYHPGGVDQLMRGAGIDATSLFDEFHAWVNIEQLLAKCYIGPLKNVVMLNLSNLDEIPSSDKKSTNISLSPPTTMSSSLSSLRKPSDKSPIHFPAQINPRFDWIQRKNDINIYFYLRSFCNPGVTIEQICDKEFNVTIFIGNTIHTYKFSFYKDLKWPAILKVNQETGKIELSFEKSETELWPNYGMHEKINAEYDFSEFFIVQKKCTNHDSFEFILRPTTDKIIRFISIGHHVEFKLNIHGRDVTRSYTPIPEKYVSCIDSLRCLNFRIKKYEVGNMSKHLCEMNPNDRISVSHQLGSFELNRLKNHTNVALLSAGSGITAFCGLIDHLLERSFNKIESLFLYDFNKTEQDIWFHEIFNEMTQRDERFKVKYILSEPEKSWTGGTGNISENILDELMKFDKAIGLICGPLSFNSAALKILSAIPKIETICFQG